MKVYKIGVKRFTDILFNGEIWQLNNEYWTTVNAETDRQAKLMAMKNLKVRMAQSEWFIRNVRWWKNIQIDLSDMVIGE